MYVLTLHQTQENLYRLFFFACLILIITACAPSQPNLEPTSGPNLITDESTLQTPTSQPPIVTVDLPSPQITVSPDQFPSPELDQGETIEVYPEVIAEEPIEASDELIPEPPAAVSIQTIPVDSPNLIGTTRAPTGLIFRTPVGLWQVEPDATTKYLTPINSAVLSPNGRFALYKTASNDLHLLDFENKLETIAVPATASGYFSWLNDHQAIAGYWNPGDEIHGVNIGRLGLFDTNTGNFTPLGTEPNNMIPAYSQARQTLLFSTSEAQFILPLGGGSPQKFGMVQFEGFPTTVVFKPQSASWSPDGNMLAWILLSDHTASTFIFDLENKTASLIYSYQPIGFAGPLPAPTWSPDGRWLAQVAFVGDDAHSGLWLFSTQNRDNRLLSNGVWSNPKWVSDSSALIATHHGLQQGTATFFYDMALQGWKSLELDREAKFVDLIVPSVTVTRISG